MAPIRSYLDEEAAFDAEATQSMGQAFAQACAALHIPPDDRHNRREVAARIFGGDPGPAAEAAGS